LALVTLVADVSSLIGDSSTVILCFCVTVLFPLAFLDLLGYGSLLRDWINQSQGLCTSFKEETTSVFIKTWWNRLALAVAG
jgi:hypothetical protein